MSDGAYYGSCKVPQANKPPLGIIPRWRVTEIRIEEINQAINRFIEAKQEIPVEWIKELNELLLWLKFNENK